MSQADFQYECSRAELLGLPPPTWEEFSANSKLKPDITEDGDSDVQPEDTIEGENVEELATQGENIKRTGGGFDELNAILATTQHKINKFKTVCGSFTNLMKLRGWKNEDAAAGEQESGSSSIPGTPNRRKGGAKGSGDMNLEVADQVDRLDSLIGKAERAELSINCQNKQMKKFLNK